MSIDILQATETLEADQMVQSDGKMNPEVKKLWCDALRSEKYSQGRHALRSRNSGGYCCLGVLEQVFGLSIGQEDRLADTSIASRPTLTKEAAEWAGFTYGDEEDYVVIKPVVVPKSIVPEDRAHFCPMRAVSLISANDTLHLNFNQIADLIEAQL